MPTHSRLIWSRTIPNTLRVLICALILGTGEGNVSRVYGDDAPKDSPIVYVKPKGWMLAGPSQFVAVQFEIVDDDQKAKTTVSKLPPRAGMWLLNVNRWRAQIGLEAVDEAELSSEKIKVQGIEGQYISLESPEKSILGVMVQRDDGVWFFKMLGSRELVSQQKMAFNSFVRSVKFKKS